MVASSFQHHLEPMLTQPIPCQICTYQSHGVNFNVMTCRACAAFFRRSLVCGMRYHCKTRKNDCRIDSTERHFCRLCRFQKCLQMGMKAEKIQQNRDPISSTFPGTSTEPELSEIVDPENEKSYIFHGTLYGFKSLLAEVRYIFSISRNYSDSPLTDLENGFKLITRHQKRRYIDIEDRINFQNLTDFRLGHIKNCATWLTHSSFFQSLTETENLLILKSTWHVWSWLELLSVSVEIFGNQVCEEKIVFLSEKIAVDIVKVFRYILKPLNKQEKRKVEKELNPIFHILFDDVARKLQNLKPSSLEINYMLWQLVWFVAEKVLNEDNLRHGEQYTNQLASDLHNHYKNDLHLEQYAQRVLKMMAIVKSLQKHLMNIHKIIDYADNFCNLFAMK
ncbi:Nuclear hormone receptor family member nhr-218 [Caenorhabditis elegans]|uniref:Nuclear hormone receptor family member nhr-218 n=1 Tax=Caenorhabditis elegans TaxID=6239 RepID=NH218_CAEEL|nr:Nuclear hormone receptor family member nhr-218 [Caenorhabditis elegans]O18086.2 RecName: Full=Nuclear hormone receptor family member nhr-218 [Caenorhabditis elegans]CAB07670.2 Nuclear hormone receptor family member nhr-218 [Caenorhabditis elegans]|eukprot:NP_507103.2 Nuclear hormone receptor family member nhr-218 [Caenorhabditis elegans]